MTTNTTKKKRASTKKRRSNGEGTVRKVLGRMHIRGGSNCMIRIPERRSPQWARGRSRIEVVELLRDVKLRFEKGQSLHSNKRTVEQYLREWLGHIRSAYEKILDPPLLHAALREDHHSRARQNSAEQIERCAGAAIPELAA